MKTKKIIILIYGAIILMSTTCRKETETCHHNLLIFNNSNAAAYVSFSLAFPDTSIIDPNPALSPEFFKVTADEKKNLMFSNRDCIEDVFKYRVQSDTISIFIYDAFLLESTSWDKVKQDYLIFKRYDLSLQDLKNRNFTITYP